MHCNSRFNDKMGEHINDLNHVYDICDAPTALDKW